jgi:hypothetical protein
VSKNPSWGYTRIQGALLNLEIKVGRSTVRRILRGHLIEPAPARGRCIRWSVFLKAHWRVVAASDFFTVEAWSWTGLVAHYDLFVIDLATRRVSVCGITLICRATFLSGEDSFLQHKAGLLDKPAFDSFVTGAHSFFASPGLRAMWRLSSGQYGGEFREFITLIVDQTPVARDADTFPSGGNYCNWKRGL